jgi:hypothetical protein
MDVAGNYDLELRIGDNLVPLQPQMIEELTIAQDIERLVPTLTLRIKDATNLLASVVPHDKQSNSITLIFSRPGLYDKRNTFNFSVKRRRALSDGTYEVYGSLSTEGLFSPYRNRALTGNLRSSIESIVFNELKLEIAEVGSSLNYVKTVIQPYWTNARLLRYLKDRVEGSGGETCYYCFINNKNGVPALIFKSIEELFLSEITYNFIVGARQFENFFPVSEHRIYDNSQIRSFFSARTANYNYFNYESGVYTSSSSIDLDSCPSLSKYYLVDKEDTTNMSIPYLGRSNDFTSDFRGKIGQKFYGDLTNSVHMWISTWGIEDIVPGDIVLVVFAEAMVRGGLFVYQHSGFWMVKRVVHLLGNSFMTNLLLVRCGVDTNIETSLTPATEVRKE